MAVLCASIGHLLARRSGTLEKLSASDGSLVCRNHQWRFDAETGKRQHGQQCLRACPLETDKSGEISVDLSTLSELPKPVSQVLRPLDTIPGPKGLPLVGNALQIVVDRMHEQLETWALWYGPLYRLRLGPQPALIVSEPTLVERVLRARPETFRRWSKLGEVWSEMGFPGVVTREGDLWRRDRRFFAKALSASRLREFYPTMKAIAERLHRRFDRAASRGEVLDVAEELRRFTVDVTTEIGLGYSINSIEDKDDPIRRKIDMILPATNRRLTAVFPYWRFIRMPADRRIDRAIADLHEWLARLIAETRRRVDAEPLLAQQPRNFLEAMVATRDETGKPISDDVIAGNAIEFLLGGEDTTANTVAWTIHELCDNPVALAALRAELNEIMKDADVPPDVECANRLAFAAAIANETMRLRPVSPMIHLEANRDVVVGDVQVPKNAAVLVLVRPPVLDEINFGDPHAFRPERWLGHAGACAHEPSVHMPFGAGPRICPGRTLALLEMQVMLATLFKRFDFIRVGDGSKVTERFGFTIRPSELRVRVVRT